MSLQESVDRKNQSKEPYPTPDYFWWHGKDFAALVEQYNSLGATNVKTVKAYTGIDENGRADMWMRVVTESGEVFDFNVGHPCPPCCPDSNPPCG